MIAGAVGLVMVFLLGLAIGCDVGGHLARREARKAARAEAATWVYLWAVEYAQHGDVTGAAALREAAMRMEGERPRRAGPNRKVVPMKEVSHG